MLGSVPLWLWVAFHLLLFALLALEIRLQRRANKKQSPLAPAPTAHTAAFWMTALWIAAALLFALVIGHILHPKFAAEYLAGYGIEESLSIDNLFVFLLLFRSFHLNWQQQRRVLFWGVLGAILLRACMIAAGLTLLRMFSWVHYAFGILLLLAALRLLRPHPAHEPPRWIAWLTRQLPLSMRPAGDHFFVREEGRLRGTQLLLALVVIEITDLFFAVDSIPAVLAVSHHTFVVYTSNIFAVMGLRSLYFVVAGMLERLSWLHYGLAAILLFTGAKMLLEPRLEISIALSLGVLGAVLALTALLSLRQIRK